MRDPSVAKPRHKNQPMFDSINKLISAVAARAYSQGAHAAAEYSLQGVLIMIAVVVAAQLMGIKLLDVLTSLARGSRL
jgi:hypothetical protein